MRFFIGKNCSHFLTLAIAKNGFLHRYESRAVVNVRGEGIR
jgi:hypothetical protein